MPAGPTDRGRSETEASYGIPDDREGLLPWSTVADRVRDERTFWVTTTRPDGRPHARPVWIDGAFHCGGGERTRWVRNLASNPAITVHTEDGESVVIVEGVAERLTPETASRERLERIDDRYEEKYDVRHGTPVFAVRPTTALAWNDYPAGATRWRFGEAGER